MPEFGFGFPIKMNLANLQLGFSNFLRLVAIERNYEDTNHWRGTIFFFGLILLAIVIGKNKSAIALVIL